MDIYIYICRYGYIIMLATAYLTSKVKFLKSLSLSKLSKLKMHNFSISNAMPCRNFFWPMIHQARYCYVISETITNMPSLSCAHIFFYMCSLYCLLAANCCTDWKSRRNNLVCAYMFYDCLKLRICLHIFWSFNKNINSYHFVIIACHTRVQRNVNLEKLRTGYLFPEVSY